MRRRRGVGREAGLRRGGQLSFMSLLFLRDLEDLTSLFFCLPFVTFLEMGDGMDGEEGGLAPPCVVVGLLRRREEQGDIGPSGCRGMRRVASCWPRAAAWSSFHRCCLGGRRRATAASACCWWRREEVGDGQPGGLLEVGGLLLA